MAQDMTKIDGAKFRPKTYKLRSFVQTKINNTLREIEGHKGRVYLLIASVTDGDGQYVPVAIIDDESSYLLHYFIQRGFYVTN